MRVATVPLTSFCRLNATRQRPSAFSPRPWAERIKDALGEDCRHRPVQYLNNVLEQDHRAIKRRIRASQHFRSFWGAWHTIAGYEAIHMIRKGQASGSAPAARPGLLHRFILGLLTIIMHSGCCRLSRYAARCRVPASSARSSISSVASRSSAR